MTKKAYIVNDGRVQDEVTGDLTAVLNQNGSTRLWKTISLVLGLIIAGGTILSVVGKAFYVTRTEYTDRVLQDSIKVDRLANSLDALRLTMTSLESTIKQDVDMITTIRLEMAAKAIEKNRR